MTAQPPLRTVQVGPAAKWITTQVFRSEWGPELSGSVLFCRVCVEYLPGRYIYRDDAFEEYVHDECAGLPMHPKMEEAAARIRMRGNSDATVTP